MATSSVAWLLVRSRLVSAGVAGRSGRGHR